MKSDRALYILAALILAVGVSGGFRETPQEWLACLASRTGQWLEQAPVRFESWDASGIFADQESRWDRQLELTVARSQAQIACAQATFARKQAAFDRLRAEQDRLHARLERLHVTPRLDSRQIVLEVPTRVVVISDDGQ
jgi:hypothetical protein